MAYGPLPYDLALEKWRAGQEPQGQAAPYDPALAEADYGDPYAGALAENDAPRSPSNWDYVAPPFVQDAVKRAISGAIKGAAEENKIGGGNAFTQPLYNLAAGGLGAITGATMGGTLKEMDEKKAAEETKLQVKAAKDAANAADHGPPQQPRSYREVYGGGGVIQGVGGPQLGLPNETKMGFARRAHGIGAQGEANAASAMLEGEYAGKHAQMYDALLKEESEMESRYKGMRERVEGSRDQAFEDYRKGVEDLSKMQIDPNRLYHDGGIPFVMTALAGAIGGGIASAVQGGPNQYLEQLDKMLNRDINAQAANIQNKRAVNAEKQNLVQYWYGRLKDVDAAKLAAKQTSLEHFNQALQRSLYDFKDKDSQNRIKSALAITEQAEGENEIQLGDKMMAVNAANAANAAALGAAQMKASAEALMTPSDFNTIQSHVIFTSPDGNGPAFMANNPEIAKEFNNKLGATYELQQLASLVKEEYAKNGNSPQLVSLFSQFADRARVAAKAGALDAGTLEERKNLFGDANSFSMPFFNKRWLKDPATSVGLIDNYANREHDLSIQGARRATGGRQAEYLIEIPTKAGITSGYMPLPYGPASMGTPGGDPTTFTPGGGTATPSRPKKKKGK